MPEYKIKPYEELDITDNFMFCKVFSNEDVAKDFLQDVLKIDIEKISVVAEATSQEDPFRKSVRLDVLVREELVAAEGERRAGRYFDIELQMANTGELPKRARYYQGMCDLDALAKGVDYEELSRSSTSCSSARTTFSIRGSPFTGSRTSSGAARKFRSGTSATKISIYLRSTPKSRMRRPASICSISPPSRAAPKRWTASAGLSKNTARIPQRGRLT